MQANSAIGHAAALAVVLLAACADDPIPLNPTPIEVLIPVARSVQLRIPGTHAIGTFHDGLITRAGDVVISDLADRAVKVFTGEGEFVRILGSNGNGPGEYNLPREITLDPASGTILLVSADSPRYTEFGIGGNYLGGSLVEEPINPFSVARLGKNLVVAGQSHDWAANEIYDLVVIDPDSGTVAQSIRRPASLSKGVAGNIYGATLHWDAAGVLAVGNLAWTLYSISPVDRSVDSMVIPEEIMPRQELPDTTPRGASAMRELIRSLTWIRHITRSAGGVVVLETSFVDGEDWARRIALYDGEWRLSTPCECVLVGTVGDTVVTLSGGPDDPFFLEYRPLRRWAAGVAP